MANRLVLKDLCRLEIGLFGTVVYRNAIIRPDEEASVYRSERITFGQFNERVNSRIHALNAMGGQQRTGRQ
jgi:hypothetical protein